jgi:hypothetical protein
MTPTLVSQDPSRHTGSTIHSMMTITRPVSQQEGLGADAERLPRLLLSQNGGLGRGQHAVEAP